ncbi:hypothetical protein BX600DRAFT_428841 [Xylariales sp. PMI_506]|nr:hypothetical protein BX600DRAFT_428841 [Xylariales sp. PMI_506]
MPKKSSQKPGGESSSAQNGDSRFASFQSDPRFRLPSKKSTKTTIDKRFKRMLKDEDFTASAKVDRYGRKLKSDNKKKALKNLYQADSGEEEEEEEEEDDGAAKVNNDDDVKRDLKKAKAKANYDPARGGGFSSSSESESDSEEEEEEEDKEAAVDTAGSMQRLRDAQADVEVGDITNRIAIVNLDWDHIKSTDLMSLFTSFVPKGGRIERVSIYPSEFGKERMQREELEGPPKEIFKKKSKGSQQDVADDSEDSQDEESQDDEDIKNDLLQEGDDQDFDSDALRTYQIDRLRYYYAILVCSDPATAEKIYQATDGSEYMTSSNFLDLRFVPDDVTFDDEPRDECDSIPLDYRPTEFTTDALQHSKVKLTWDMHPDEASRRENIKRAFGGSRSDLQENDLKAYLASSSEDEGDAEEDDGAEEEEEKEEKQPKLSKKELARQKMREALGLGSESIAKSSKSGPVGEMEMTFTLGDDDNDGDGASADKSGDVEETTVERYMRKERERKARRKEKALAKREDTGAPAKGEAAAAAADGQEDDLGFDDPFFTTDEPVKVTKSSLRKEERLKKRELKAAEARESSAQKAQLERIMAEDSKDGVDHLDHFDMNEIARVEKMKYKKGKRKQKELVNRGGLQEGFKMNVDDDRFKAVFDDHEFAIDPSDPKFKATPGMKQLLEEGRKKRSHGDEHPTRPKKARRR